MDIRDERQKEFKELYLRRRGRSILNLSPRLGKTKIGVEIMKEIGGRILLAYPSLAIRKSWQDDFTKWGYDDEDVIFTTYKSIHKYKGEKFALAVLDEIHSTSLGQMESIGEVLEGCTQALGLTGTLNKDSERDLSWYAGFDVIGSYSIEEAIKDKIVSDYEIRVIEVSLDDKYKTKHKSRTGVVYYTTELMRYNRLCRMIDTMEEKHQDTFAPRIKRMQLLQNSIGKKNAIESMLSLFQEDRLLLFCATTAMADSFGIPAYHSKKKEEDMLNAFCKGEGNHLAAVKMLSAGITFKPLSLGIISCVDSNSENFGQKVARFLNYEFENDKAVIYIVSSNTIVEKGWIRKALEFLDDTKVEWNYRLFS